MAGQEQRGIKLVTGGCFVLSPHLEDSNSIVPHSRVRVWEGEGVWADVPVGRTSLISPSGGRFWFSCSSVKAGDVMVQTGRGGGGMIRPAKFKKRGHLENAEMRRCGEFRTARPHTS